MTEGQMDNQETDLTNMMAEKAREIFCLFDQENKGFITKDDLLKLENELPQTPEQLEVVFDKLDIHRNGYLTLAEFTEGFGSFLGLSSSSFKSELYEDESVDEVFEYDSQQFDDIIRNIKGFSLLQDVGVIKSLWMHIHQNQPEMLDNFEDFLRRITSELEHTHMNYEMLQAAMENKRFAHDKEIRALYMEMESQINAEKERIQLKEKAKEKHLRERLEMELVEKDKRLHELLTYQNEMENKLMKLNANEVCTKHEKEILLKEKEAMEEELDSSTQDLKESKYRIAYLQELQRERNRRGSQAAAQITDWIVLERESLLRQLQELKDMNRKLLDNQDEIERKKHEFNHTPHIRSQQRTLDQLQISPETVSGKSLLQQINMDELDNRSYTNETEKSEADKHASLRDHMLDEIDAADEGEEPIGSSASSYSYKEENDFHNISIPQRLYKIVFVGDSGVGKSSYIYRICRNSFISSFVTTIGVDFQVHSVKVDDQIVALQLWDTAGQERFRSITQQYFRKADGVIVMYDVTSDYTFRSMRDWLEGIKETVEKETVIVIIGNKMDMVEEDVKKVISSKHGRTLAEQYEALFFETSARSGLNVAESIQQMSSACCSSSCSQCSHWHQTTFKLDAQIWSS